MKRIKLTVVDLIQNKVTTNGHVMVNFEKVAEVLKHRDAVGNAYCSVVYINGIERLVQEEPHVIDEKLRNLDKSDFRTFENNKLRAPQKSVFSAPPSPVASTIDRPTTEFPDDDPSFKTRV